MQHTAIAPSGLIGLARSRMASWPGTSLGAGDDIAQSLAGDGLGIEINEITELSHQLRHATGMMEMLHIVLA